MIENSNIGSKPPPPTRPPLPLPLPQIVNTYTGNVAKGCELLLFAHDNVYLQQVPRSTRHIL